ncbi:hypothetical protein ACFLXE_05410 [Chloroflexota bacterium]
MPDNLASQSDIQDLRDKLQGSGTKDFTTLETAVAAVETAIGNLQTSSETLQDVVDAIQALQAANETLQDIIDGIAGAAGSTQTIYGLEAGIRGASSKDLTTLETSVAAVQTAVEALRTISTLDTLETAIAAVGTLVTTLDAVVDLIKAKTDNIPSDPAKESGKLTTIDSTLSTAITDGALARQDTVASVLAAFEPHTNQDTSTGAVLTVSLDCSFTGGKTEVDIWVKSSAAATFNVEGSTDNSNWRQLRRRKYSDDALIDVEVVLAGAGEDHIHIQNAYRYLRVVTTDENDNEIEIAASR